MEKMSFIVDGEVICDDVFTLLSNELEKVKGKISIESESAILTFGLFCLKAGFDLGAQYQNQKNRETLDLALSQAKGSA